jgi:hypothetical protein
LSFIEQFSLIYNRFSHRAGQRTQIHITPKLSLQGLPEGAFCFEGVALDRQVNIRVGPKPARLSQGAEEINTPDAGPLCGAGGDNAPDLPEPLLPFGFTLGVVLLFSRFIILSGGGDLH